MRVAAGLFGVIVAAALAGCGGTERQTREELARQVTRVESRLERRIDRLRRARSVGALKQRLEQAGHECRQDANDLDQSAVPDDAEEAKQRLVDALRQLADDLDETAKIVEKRTLRAVVAQLNASDFQSLRDARQSIDELVRASAARASPNDDRLGAPTDSLPWDEHA